MKMFTVYDSKAKCYLNPFVMRNSAEAIRSFHTVCNDPQTNFSKYPSDFTLFEIGEWNDDEGQITMHEAKQALGLAQDFKEEVNAISNEE
jgi:hypothetical protein